MALEHLLNMPPEPEPHERLLYLKGILRMADNWLRILSIDEAFVVRKHLIEQIAWSRVTVLYRQQWGQEFEKDERTLKKYQADALQRIANFTNKHKDVYARYLA